jgi:hypothetical protein
MKLCGAVLSYGVGIRTIGTFERHRGNEMADPTSGIALKVGIEVLSRVTPKGYAWVKSKIVGRDILVVGQARAGKTSLQKFLQYGLFAEPDSPRTRADRVTASFTVSMGRDESLHLQVRKVVDTVGQVSAATHAALVNEYRPHVLMIVLDASAPWKGDDESYAGSYLAEFLDEFVPVFLSRYFVRRKLKAIFILLNKCDRLKESTAKNLLRKAKDLVHQKISPSTGFAPRAIVIRECSFLESYDKGVKASAIIQKIALTLEDH